MSKYNFGRAERAPIKRCYESHPALPIGDFVIYGGSCLDPIVTDADIYVGFDLGMKVHRQSYPWESGEAFLFPIQDMGVPTSRGDFMNLLCWLERALHDKKKVHIGCIGGHGRTGTVLAALVKQMTGNEDAITYVRENYCQKAVESTTQIEFLRKEFGILKVPASKELVGRQAPARATAPAPDKKAVKLEAPPVLTASPSKNTVNIWGKNATFDKSHKSGTIR